jgi:intracellular sulfur oxidation DsrE/DsrF family protein
MAQGTMARRSVITRFGLVASAALAFGSKAVGAQAPARPFQAARHTEDDWLDAVAGKHRTIVDAATASGAGESILYANHLYVANQSGYALAERDVAVVVCVRHFATTFAYNDAMWAKYGKVMSAMLSFTDPKTKQAPSTNLLNSADYGMALPSLGNTIPSIVKRGTHFAVCGMATRFFSGELAKATGGSADAVYAELTANLIPNSHMVAAGVVAVNRAQERGYTLLTAL